MTIPKGPVFERYIGIDYSGAKTPTDSLRNLRVYTSNHSGPPLEVAPPPSPRKYWTRREVAEWLAERLAEPQPTLVGIDHGFSFPMAYFKTHNLPLDWPAFLEDFQRHWPTDEDHTYVDFVMEGNGSVSATAGGGGIAELQDPQRPSPCSSFDVQGSVAKSTHSGLPWLLYLRRKLAGKIHFWPFDGWDIPAGRSIVAEVYPSLWSRGFSTGRTQPGPARRLLGDRVDAASRSQRRLGPVFPSTPSTRRRESGPH